MEHPTARIAWRNLWRNPRRTVVTASAVGLGLAAMVFVTGWAKGINRHLVNSAIRSGIGAAQMTAPGYLATGDPETYIKDFKPALARADAAPAVMAASPRAQGEGLLAIGARSSFVRLTGVIPEREARVTDWKERIVKGSFLGAPSTVVIGQGLADNLEVDVGSKLVLTVADIRTGEMKYRLVRVAGIISSENPSMEKRTAITAISELAEDMGMPGGAHEIALAVTGDLRDRERLVAAIAPLAGDDVEAAEWQRIVPVLAKMGEIQNFFMVIFLGVIFFLISFGIVNTMSMALLERFREFGVMRALGATPSDLFSLIFLEAGCLGMVGSAGGLALGLNVLWWFSVRGIPLGGVEVMDMAFKTPIYPVFHWPSIAFVTVAFLVLTPLASTLVAFKASRVNPATALRTE